MNIPTSVIQSLNETIALCSKHADSKLGYLSTRLIDFEGRKIVESESLWRSKLQYEYIYNLISARSKSMGQDFEYKFDLSGGKILCSEINNSDSCGMSPPETNGYIDVDDIPGWDTWFHCYKHPKEGNYILAWVPPEFVDGVQSAIECNPMECIYFIDESELEKYI